MLLREEMWRQLRDSSPLLLISTPGLRMWGSLLVNVQSHFWLSSLTAAPLVSVSPPLAGRRHCSTVSLLPRSCWGCTSVAQGWGCSLHSWQGSKNMSLLFNCIIVCVYTGVQESTVLGFILWAQSSSGASTKEWCWHHHLQWGNIRPW